MSTGSELVVRTSNLPALVSDNSLVSYMEQIKKFPVLSEAEEEKLVVDFQSRGDIASASGSQNRFQLPSLRIADGGYYFRGQYRVDAGG